MLPQKWIKENNDKLNFTDKELGFITTMNLPIWVSGLKIIMVMKY